MDFISEATNIKQYDKNKWSDEKELEAHKPYRKLYCEYLQNAGISCKGVEVLDIGCGVGWFLQFFKENGAASVEGIDPSLNNVQVAKKLHPDIKIHNCDLNSFTTKKKYDLITSIMVFSHIDNLVSAFEKIREMLKDKGDFLIVVPDYNYSKKPEKRAKIEIRELNPDAYVTCKRESNFGSITDIVRKTKVYLRAAEDAGLKLVKEVGLVPTKSLIAEIPWYAGIKNTAIMRILIFRKR